MFPIIALILFILAFFEVTLNGNSLVPLGLAAIALTFLVGNWPIGTWGRRI